MKIRELQQEASAVAPNYLNRQVTFQVRDDCLVRTITGTSQDWRFRGRGSESYYVQRCPRDTFELVAKAVAATPRDGRGTSASAIAYQHRLPRGPVDVAMAFLKDRGIVVIPPGAGGGHHRCYPATKNPLLDALCEYAALELVCQQR